MNEDVATQFTGVYQLLSIDLPDAPRIKKLEQWLADPESFRMAVGSAPDSALLGNALWACTMALSAKTVKTGSKRVFLFTDRDNPHDGNVALQRAAKVRARVFSPGLASVYHLHAL